MKGVGHCRTSDEETGNPGEASEEWEGGAGEKGWCGGRDSVDSANLPRDPGACLYLKQTSLGH